MILEIRLRKLDYVSRQDKSQNFSRLIIFFEIFCLLFLSISISRSITKEEKITHMVSNELSGVAMYTLYTHCFQITLESSSFYNQFVRPTDWLLRAQKPLIIASWLDGKKARKLNSASPLSCYSSGTKKTSIFFGCSCCRTERDLFSKWMEASY